MNSFFFSTVALNSIIHREKENSLSKLKLFPNAPCGYRAPAKILQGKRFVGKVHYIKGLPKKICAAKIFWEKEEPMLQ